MSPPKEFYNVSILKYGDEEDEEMPEMGLKTNHWITQKQIHKLNYI